MIEAIPENILDIYKKLEGKNFKVYFVGGCVRDLLLGKKVKDWDLTTNATPEEILKVFKNGFYDNKFGTVGVPVAKQVVEITTFRTEKGYKDRRHPEKVEWGKTLEEDLSRRDFTINSIALCFLSENNQTLPNIIDPFNGQNDLEKRILKTVGNPKERFKEDALRLMRAIRLAAQFDFEIEKETFKEIKNDALLIKEISKERIRDELMKILTSKRAYDGIILLKEAGLIEHILPEILGGKGISQARPGRHHTDDVFTHNLLSLKHCPSKDPIVRFAALIHDVGKPEAAGKDNQGYITFHNHEIVGARIARDICERLRFSKKDRDKVVNLIRWHMFTVDEKITDAAVRRFIRRVGVENVKDIIDLRIGDRLGGGTQTAESWRLKLFKKRVQEQLAPKPFSIEDMVLDGNDLMRILDIKPGPVIGEILEKLFEEVDEDLSRNNREYLIKRAKEVYQKAP